jgi:hypothetical protein
VAIVDTATGDAPRRDLVEIVATVVLALAAVATAWSSYQATRWNGEQAKASSRVNALRIEAARAEGLSETQTQVDVATFIQWVDASTNDDRELATFYRDRFRAEFRPAFDAWLATDPLSDADAPPTPFAMDEYRLEATAEAERLDAEAELMAVALFFAGMSSKLRGAGPRKAMLVIGAVLFVGTAVWIATFPISISL